MSGEKSERTKTKLQPSSFVNISRLPETRQQQQTAQKGDEEKEGAENSMDDVGFTFCVAMIVLKRAWIHRESCGSESRQQQTAADESSIANHSTCLGVSLSPSHSRCFSSNSFEHLQRKFTSAVLSLILFPAVCASSFASVRVCSIHHGDENQFFSYVTIIVVLLRLCDAFQVTRERKKHRKCVEA